MTADEEPAGVAQTDGPIRIAQELIRAGQHDEAIELLTAKLAELPDEDRPEAHNVLGLAFYFGGQYPEAFSWFAIAAQGTAIPELWFNLAMSQMKIGDLEGGLTTWQQVVDLSYSHQDAPETSTFFEKKLLFAEALAEAGLCDSRGLAILQELVPFYTNNHITDTQFWASRGVPTFRQVVELALRYYRGMKKSKAEWDAFLDGVEGKVDTEGRQVVGEVRSRWESLTQAGPPPPPQGVPQ